jgi:hypothetical protein
MKITVTLVREFDTEGEDHAHLFDGITNPIDYALDCFADDVDNLVKYNEVREHARVEVK